MQYLSVCSGIEAASVAWEPLGWHPIGLSEIEPFPCHVLAHRQRASRPLFMPDPAKAETVLEQRARKAAIKAVLQLPAPAPDLVPNFGDLTRFKEWPDAAVDLLVGGTPCQSFSVAGLRKGMDDPRGNLALTYLAVADRYRPQWVVWENVPGVLSSNKGRDFGAFLGGLGELGYGWAYRVLDAQFVRTRGLPRAVPQRRRRVFVVGYLGDWRVAAAVLFDSQSMRGDPPPRRKTGQSVAGTLDAGLGIRGQPEGERQHLIPEVCNALAARDAKQPRAEDNVGIIAVAPTLRAGGNATGGDRPYGTDVDTADSLIPVSLGAASALTGNAGVMPANAIQERAVSENPDAGPDGVGVRSDAAAYTLEARTTLQAVAFDALAGGDTGFAVGDVSGALHGGGKHGGRAAVAQPFTIMERGRDGGQSLESRQDGAANAILTPNGGRGGLGVGAIATPWAVRRLTPLECERLQGFPDSYTLVPYRGKPAADGPRYKALGNSMAVNAMQWIGERIAFVDAIVDAKRGSDGVLRAE